MDRPLWSGALAFGIVSIPVRLFAAVRDHDLHFHQISRTERKRIRYLKVVDGTDQEVPAADIVKGYEVKSGHYVVFDEGELARLASRKSRVIDIGAFVALGEIDPLYFDRPYRLLPDERGGKPYALLVRTLERTDRVGIAQMVMHGKEHIVAIRSLSGGLTMHTLRFSDEVIRAGGTKATAAGGKLTEREIAMAEKLVESMHGSFRPADFKDDYRARLQAAITRKARGRTLAIEEEQDEPERGKVLNLMEALERSLAKHGSRGRPAARTAKGRRPALSPTAKRSRSR